MAGLSRWSACLVLCSRHGLGRVVQPHPWPVDFLRLCSCPRPAFQVLDCVPLQALGKPRLSALERAKLEAKLQAEAAAAAADNRNGGGAAAPAVPSLDAALAPHRKTKLQLEKDAVAAAEKARAAAQRLAAAKAAAAAAKSAA